MPLGWQNCGEPRQLTHLNASARSFPRKLRLVIHVKGVPAAGRYRKAPDQCLNGLQDHAYFK